MRTPILSAAILTSYAVLMSASGAVPPAVAPGVLQDQRFEMSLLGRPGQPPHIAVPPFYVKAFTEYLRAAGSYTSNRATTVYRFGTTFTIWTAPGPGWPWHKRTDHHEPFL